ncbi:hypothetical protein QMO56_13885 [Roseomonas sp. E05]|uniref:hypothetical protein n=1 Tax=Roseomonas sp. E05 TaxID=3046310 RepID=UPI0024BAEC75|nr:hypothetical protein [Roseomonas sp. E05]MDJ0389207.1 hypothetical protein [Roseomonas sp. E05]
MTEMRIELPESLAEEIERRASELGTTPDQLLSVVVSEAVTDLPSQEDESDWERR